MPQPKPSAAQTILVLGLPPQAPDTLTCAAREAMAAADLLVGGKRQLAQFPEHPAERLILTSNVATAAAPIRAAAEAGKHVVVLASGDPLLYGVGATLLRELGSAHVRVEPAVGSVQLAFARISHPWHDATILSAHGRPLPDILPRALAATTLAILTDATSTPSNVAQALLDAGMEDCRAVVGEQLGLPEERLTDTTLGAIPGQAFDPLNILLVLRDPIAPRLRFAQPDDDYETVRGQITKAEVRAVTLSKLNLAPHGVLWDVGAGSGAISIEAARLMPAGQVYAVERDPDQLECLRRNVARHHAANVHVVEAEAPEALAGLPPPQSVFVGGSGGRLEDLLTQLPRPLVLNLAILEHVTMVLRHFPSAEVVHLAVSRSTNIASGHRLVAQNPVYILSIPAHSEADPRPETHP